MDEATWMNYYEFCNQFPTSSLVDKADLIGKGIDSSKSEDEGISREMGTLRVYYRKRLRGIFHKRRTTRRE